MQKKTFNLERGINNLLIKKELSRTRFCYRCGISIHNLNGMEKKCNPTVRTITKMADALDLSVVDFINELYFKD